MNLRSAFAARLGLGLGYLAAKFGEPAFARATALQAAWDELIGRNIVARRKMMRWERLR